MAKVALYNMEGTKTGDMEVSDAIFAAEVNKSVLHQVVVNYLANLKSYSKTTIKQNYELLCMGFGEAYHQGIIQDNFMAGYKRI